MPKPLGINQNLPGKVVESESYSPASYIETHNVGVQSVARAKASNGFIDPSTARLAHGLGSPREYAKNIPDEVVERQARGRRLANQERMRELSPRRNLPDRNPVDVLFGDATRRPTRRVLPF